MDVRFENDELEYIYINGVEKGKPKYNKEIIRAFIRKVNEVSDAGSTSVLLKSQSLNFEALKGNYKGFHSVRVNDKYRIILKVVKEKDGTITIEIIEVHDLVDYHK